MDVAEINKKIQDMIREAIHQNPESITSIEKLGEGWRVEAEILEKKALPSKFDLLKIFEFKLDKNGKIQGFKQLKRKQRGDSE